MRIVTFVLTAAAAAAALGGAAHAGDAPTGYWALWSENYGNVQGNVSLSAQGDAANMGVSTNAVGAVNAVTLAAISSSTVTVHGPLVSQSVVASAGDMVAGQNAFQQGINIAEVQLGIAPASQPVVVAYARNTGDVNASITIRSGGSISNMSLSTNAAGAVNTAVVTSSSSQTMSVGP